MKNSPSSSIMRLTRRRWLHTSLFSGAALLLVLAGCKSPDNTASTSAPTDTSSTGDDIVIGHFGSLTGSTATFGQSTDRGIHMAFDEINAKGLTLGKKITLVTEDDASKTEQVPGVVQKLINQSNVLALLGEVASSRSLAAAKIAQDSKVPMLSPASTNPKVTQQGDYIFRSCFIDPFQGAVMARFGYKNLKATKAAILTDSANDYSKGLTEVFTKEWQALGGTIVSQESYAEGDKDFQSQLTSIKAANPDIIFIPGYYTEVGNIAVQARRLGINQVMLGTDGWDSEKLYDIAKDQVQGCYFSNHYSPQSKDPKVVKFVGDYKKLYNQTPDAMAALGYDAAYILVDAIKRAGAIDRTKLRDELAKTKDFVGVTGTISMDKNRDAVKPAVVLKIEGNEGKYVTTVNP